MDQEKHAEKGPWITDLKEGQEFIGFYLARNPRLEPFRDISRGQYLRLLLVDRSGVIEARIWENAEEYASQLEDQPTVKVDGIIERYRDQLQVRINRLRPANPNEYDLSDMRPTTKRDLEMMKTAVDKAIASIENQHLHSLVRFFFDQETFRTNFEEAPAARRIHHAYLGGLLEHTYEILQLAETLITLYPAINRDLLITGILLHDIGKLDEYQWEIDIEFTHRGRLLGHVVLGAEHVARAISQFPEFPEDLALQCEHMILAHHGHYEYGSPRRPKTLEAIALHHLENLDAQVNRFNSLIEEARKEGRDWTTYDHMLGRSLYVSYADLSIEEQGFAE